MFVVGGLAVVVVVGFATVDADIVDIATAMCLFLLGVAAAVVVAVVVGGCCCCYCCSCCWLLLLLLLLLLCLC